MAYRKSRLKLSKQGVAINADVRTAKLDPEPVAEKPEIVRRDAETGTLIARQIYDKATGEPLEDGYGYRYVNEHGDEVPSENIELFRIVEDEERRFSKYEPTLGSERTVSPLTWIPVSTVDQYLVDRTYEIWGDNPEDVVQLYELAELIREYDEAPVIEVVMQPAIYKSWGIITPQFFEDSFAMIMRITQQRIEPEHAMPTMTEADLPEEDEAPTIEQQSPF